MGSTIDLKAADGHTLSAYSAGPANGTKGVVVIQEIFGVNHHMRDMADRFAAEGYAVVAPALFDRVERGVELGYTADDIAKGRDYRMKLSDAQVMADVEAAAKHLAGKQARHRRLLLWRHGRLVGRHAPPLFAASSCWYGGGITGTKDETPHCPVQMHFGETDTSIPMTDVDAIRAAQSKVEVHVYQGAGHGFGCNERGSYSKPDYEQAQKRTLDFFARHLG